MEVPLNTVVKLPQIRQNDSNHFPSIFPAWWKSAKSCSARLRSVWSCVGVISSCKDLKFFSISALFRDVNYLPSLLCCADKMSKNSGCFGLTRANERTRGVFALSNALLEPLRPTESSTLIVTWRSKRLTRKRILSCSARKIQVKYKPLIFLTRKIVKEHRLARFDFWLDEKHHSCLLLVEIRQIQSVWSKRTASLKLIFNCRA